MDAKFTEHLTIPSEEEERPVRIFNSIVLVNDARHCRPKHLWPKGGRELDQHPGWRDQIERYLAAFCEPVRTIADELRCVACDEQVTGHHVGIMDWRYRNRLTFSEEGSMEGRCTKCGYPCRLKHEISLPSGQLLVRLVGFPLFYHPTACQQTN
jgi:hypothetical protein